MVKLVLVLNFGSSSLKFAVINVINKKKYIFGIAECLNSKKSYIKWNVNNKFNKKLEFSFKTNHVLAFNFIKDNILMKYPDLFNKIIAIGHRVVHGGEKFTKPVIIDNDVIQSIKNAIHFAPLHNPLNLLGIMESLAKFPHLSKKNVAVFDTSFHQTMPRESYLYALPYFLYKKYSIRRYGAHGISHFYVSRVAAKLLNKSVNKINIISCHLGNGSSITAIKNGKCIDTSMGLTPLEGLVMGTRSGDIDPAIIFYLHNYIGISLKKIYNLLINKSGLLGLTGITNDFRYIECNYYTNLNARLAMNIYCHRLIKYIGAYIALINSKLDAIIFTGGIGENSIMLREFLLKKLSFLGFKIDKEKNLKICLGKTGIITKNDSVIPVIVIPTNEELVIAKYSFNLIYDINKK